MAQHKRSYRDDLIRGLALIIALAVFFIGPRFIETDDTRDIDATIRFVKSHRLPRQIAGPIIAQLEADKKYTQQNSNMTEFLSVKLSAVNWFALIILAVGFAGPFLLKWKHNKGAAATPAGG